MQRRTVAWMLVAAASVGWLIGPRVVSAATTLVRIQDGTEDVKAHVTEGHQLQVAEAPPSSFHEYVGSDTDLGCHPFVTVPSGKGFVLRTVSINVLTAASSGFHIVSVYPNASCSGPDLFTAPTNKVAVYTLPLDSGFALATGGGLSFRIATTGAVAAVYAWGYQVPSSDVPSTTPIN